MTKRHPAQLLNPLVTDLEEYVPIQPFEVLTRSLGRTPGQIVKLDANENPYGPLPVILDALAEYPYYHIYPDPQQTALREAISRDSQVPAANIVVGSGADELLDYLCRMFLTAGDAIIDLPPTFGMYSFDAQLTGAAVCPVWRRKDFAVDVAAVEQAVRASQRKEPGRIKMVFATSPNNPTGTWLADAELTRLLALPVMVVLDEAYVDFAHQASRMDWVLAHDNLIVLRTFSKALGIAGLRLGYGAFPAWLMPMFWKFKQPYNVNVAAMVAGLASLQHREEVAQVVQRIRRNRDTLYQSLGSVSFLQPYASAGNFLLCQVTGRDAHSVWSQLRAQGILVRYYNKPGLEDCIRISVGREEQLERLMAVLHQMDHGT